jgi:two-component system sensor histidine kinase DesK
MKWPAVPTDEGKPSWGGLVWSVPLAYVFLDPYQRHAAWTGWALTTVGFSLFLVLYVLGLIYWSRKEVLRYVCIATVLLAIAFTAYQSSFVLFFILVAAFAPFAVGGSVGLSAAFVVSVALVPTLESWLLGGRPPIVYAAVIGILSLMIGSCTTFVARQQNAMAQAHKVAERERIARDLHDILGHTLSVIILKSELANRLFESDRKRSHAEIADVERISRKALAEVREAISGYHTGGIQMEFERAHATLQAAGITVQHECERIEIPPTHERVLVLALREAVTNVVRHSQASHCQIQLCQIDGAYRLNIRDDGRGGVVEQGMGLRGMRHRAESVGGSVSCKSGRGIDLTVTLPVASAS